MSGLGNDVSKLPGELERTVSWHSGRFNEEHATVTRALRSSSQVRACTVRNDDNRDRSSHLVSQSNANSDKILPVKLFPVVFRHSKDAF